MQYGAVPNASRYLERGYTYHLTHRCHDRRFLLQTIRERHDYRKWLREGALRYDVPIYNYCVTSNHVHVIVHVDDSDAVSSMMQLASATVARHWNRLKKHEGSFWEHPFRPDHGSRTEWDPTLVVGTLFHCAPGFSAYAEAMYTGDPWIGLGIRYDR